MGAFARVTVKMAKRVLGATHQGASSSHHSFQELGGRRRGTSGSRRSTGGMRGGNDGLLPASPP
eukprot:922819-Pyramimonas_sp.AAC.1